MALLLLCVCLCLVSAALGWPLSQPDWASLARIMKVPAGALIVVAAALVVAILCLRLIFAPKTQRERKQAQPASALIKTTDNGSAYIALAALEVMAQRHIRGNSRVRDCATSIRVVEGGSVVFSVKLSVLPETPLVELTAELQKSLKEYIEEQSGILVQEISVLVESASAAPAARVE